MANGIDFDEDEGITGINVTPLVDVMLVLLIIFMVTANYINSPGIELNLPKADSGAGVEPSELTFTIDKRSKVYVDGKVLSEDELVAFIQVKKKANPKVQATIAADQDTPHGAVIRLIDIVRRNGIQDFAINVDSGQ